MASTHRTPPLPDLVVTDDRCAFDAGSLCEVLGHDRQPYSHGSMPVAPSPPYLLVVAVDTAGDARMHDGADVALVHTEAEGGGTHHDVDGRATGTTGPPGKHLAPRAVVAVSVEG